MLAISGQGTPESPSVNVLAEECGRIAAAHGATILTGGLGGVMAAAERGARAGGGRAAALLPGDDRAAHRGTADMVIATGVGEARDLALVATADAVIAIGGGWGTLAEIGLARKLGRPVVLLQTWDVRAPEGWDQGGSLPRAETAGDAVALALAAVA